MQGANFMSETVTLELPDELARRARSAAAAANRRVEDVVLDWIARAAADPSVEALPDDEVLAWCDARLDDAGQAELSDLLARHRTAGLDTVGRVRLDALMATYRQGLVLKARAWKEAVGRGLRPPPADDAA
jgi:hypothetical protein